MKAMHIRLRALPKEQRGAAAVEFALIAVPFFGLLFGIIETALLFFVSTVVEHAAMEAARDIRTGEIQKGGGETAFFDTACGEMGMVLSCANLHYDVRTFDDFESARPGSVIEDETYDPDEMKFDAGKEEEIVVVRLFYEWKLVAPFLGDRALANLENGNRLIVATVAFRNEPFGEVSQEEGA